MNTKDLAQLHNRPTAWAAEVNAEAHNEVDREALAIVGKVVLCAIVAGIVLWAVLAVKGAM